MKKLVLLSAIVTTAFAMYLGSFTETPRAQAINNCTYGFFFYGESCSAEALNGAPILEMANYPMSTTGANVVDATLSNCTDGKQVIGVVTVYKSCGSGPPSRQGTYNIFNPLPAQRALTYITCDPNSGAVTVTAQSQVTACFPQQ